MITGRQIREARRLLGWSVARLAGMADLTTMIVDRAESVDGTPSVTLDQGLQIQFACEAAGITFGVHGAVTIQPSDDITSGA